MSFKLGAYIQHVVLVTCPNFGVNWSKVQGYMGT